MELEYITTKDNVLTDAEIVQYMKLPLVLFKSADLKKRSLYLQRFYTVSC